MGYYRDKLYRVFFGNPPKFLLDVPEDLIPCALELQGIHYVNGGLLPDNIIKLNFTQLIQDIYELDKARDKEHGFPDEEVKLASGIFMRSEFREWIQDPQKDNWQKLYKCIYYKGLLLSLVKIYNYELIDNQIDFLNELIGTEQYYTKLVEEEVAPFLLHENQQQEKANKPFELSTIWPHGIEKLKELSLELKQIGFTSDELEFANVFDITKEDECNWRKPITTLVFLFCFLFSPGKSDIPTIVVTHLEKRFSVKGKRLTKKLIQTTFSNIRPHINKRQDKLTGEYAIIYEAYKSIIP